MISLKNNFYTATLVGSIFSSSTFAANTNGQKVSITYMKFYNKKIYFGLSSPMDNCGGSIILDQETKNSLYAALLNTYSTNGNLIIDLVDCNTDAQAGDLNALNEPQIKFIK